MKENLKLLIFMFIF